MKNFSRTITLSLLLLYLCCFGLPSVKAAGEINRIWPQTQVSYWGLPLQIDVSVNGDIGDYDYKWFVCVNEEQSCPEGSGTELPRGTTWSSSGWPNLLIPFNGLLSWPKGHHFYSFRLEVWDKGYQNRISYNDQISALFLQHPPFFCDARPEEISLYRGINDTQSYRSYVVDVDQEGSNPITWLINGSSQGTDTNYLFDLSAFTSLLPNDTGYPITLDVSDSAAQTCFDTTLLKVENQRPQVTILPERMRVYNDAANIIYNLSASDPESDTPLSYSWSRNGNLISGATDSSYTQDPSSLLSTSYDISATVTDKYGAAKSIETSLQILNRPPNNVAINPKYTEIYLGESVVLSPTLAVDPDRSGTHLSYSWYEVPGTLASQVTTTNANFTYTPNSLGTKLIKLVVNDNSVTSASSETITYTKVVVKNHSPRVSLGANRVVPDSDLTLTATASDEDSGQILSFSWKYDKMDLTGNGSSITIPASTLTPGDHTLTVTANDNSGLTNEPATSTDTINIKVVNATPEASITPNYPISLMPKTSLVPYPETFDLDGTAWDPDQGANLLNYRWVLNGATPLGCTGNLAAGVALPSCKKQALPAVGQYYADLRLDDNYGAFPFRSTTLDRIALIAVSNLGFNVPWMQMGSVTVDSTSPELKSSDLGGYSKNAATHYIGSDSNVTGDGEFSDNFAVKYSTLRLVNKDVNSVEQYLFKFDWQNLRLHSQEIANEQHFSFVSATPDLTGPDPKITFTLQSKLEDGKAARYDVFYKTEDATTYAPATGNTSAPEWEDTGMDLVIDAIKPQVVFDNCPNTTWTNQTNLTLTGSVDDTPSGYSDEWTSSGLPSSFDSTSSLTQDTADSITEPITLDLNSSEEWSLIHDYAEEHPKLELVITDKVGNVGSGICQINLDTSAPTLLGSNPEEGGLMFDPSANLEVVLQEIHHSDLLSLGDEIELGIKHGIDEDTISLNENIILYAANGPQDCEQLDLANMNYQALNYPQHLIKLIPEDSLAYQKSYRLVINSKLDNSCEEVALNAEEVDDLAGNPVPKTDIPFSTTRGSGLLSLKKDAFAIDAVTPINYIIPSKASPVNLRITLRAPEDRDFGLSDGWKINDSLPPYLEIDNRAFSEDLASFTIYDADNKIVGGTPLFLRPSTPADSDSRLGQNLVWELPGKNIPAFGRAEILYPVKLNALFLPSI